MHPGEVGEIPLLHLMAKHVKCLCYFEVNGLEIVPSKPSLFVAHHRLLVVIDPLVANRRQIERLGVLAPDADGDQIVTECGRLLWEENGV